MWEAEREAAEHSHTGKPQRTWNDDSEERQRQQRDEPVTGATTHRRHTHSTPSHAQIDFVEVVRIRIHLSQLLISLQLCMIGASTSTQPQQQSRSNAHDHEAAAST